MKSGHVLRASAIALVLAFMLAIPASAQRDDDRDRDRGERNCKGDRISASGSAVSRPFSRQKELAGKGAAFANAVITWQREVRTKYGEFWMQYERARGKDGGRVSREDFDCQDARVSGKNFIRCTISGDPCARRAETTEVVAPAPCPPLT